MAKGEETKQRIIEQTAIYLNQRGYFSTAAPAEQPPARAKGGLAALRCLFGTIRTARY